MANEPTPQTVTVQDQNSQTLRDPEDPVDWSKLTHWMNEKGIGSGSISNVTTIGGGTQNILLKFLRGDHEYVFRRPPLHKRANSDETMRREARVLAALASTPVPHPFLVAAGDDASVTNSAFYIMESINGFNAVTDLPEICLRDKALQRRMSFSMIDSLAEIGQVDIAKVGLSNFGHAEGWLDRQVSRWRSQLKGYSTIDGFVGTDLPGVERIAAWLTTEKPSSWIPGLIHGDFHFGNVMFKWDDFKVAAIVDWELASIGDPLLDLAHLLALSPQPASPPRTAMIELPGIPTRLELIDHYARRCQRDLSSLTWYQVLACFRLGIILEGTFARSQAGLASVATGIELHDRATGLFLQAHSLIETHEAGNP